MGGDEGGKAVGGDGLGLIADLERAGAEAEAAVERQREMAEIERRLTLLADHPVAAPERSAAASEKPLRLISERKLSHAAQAYCRLVSEGKSKRQAYREAYQNTTASDATITASANKLGRDPRIVGLIDSLTEEHAERLVEDHAAARRYAMRSLLALSKTGETDSARLRALELLGRAAGLFTAAPAAAAAPTAETLRAELAGHLKLVGKRVNDGA